MVTAASICSKPRYFIPLENYQNRNLPTDLAEEPDFEVDLVRFAFYQVKADHRFVNDRVELFSVLAVEEEFVEFFDIFLTI